MASSFFFFSSNLSYLLPILSFLSVSYLFGRQPDCKILVGALKPVSNKFFILILYFMIIL